MPGPGQVMGRQAAATQTNVSTLMGILLQWRKQKERNTQVNYVYVKGWEVEDQKKKKKGREEGGWGL